jgi:hypothetical protein
MRAVGKRSAEDALLLARHRVRLGDAKSEGIFLKISYERSQYYKNMLLQSKQPFFVFKRFEAVSRDISLDNLYA